jgi:UDP-glucose 4-epimerase
MHILILGGQGFLGKALQTRWAQHAEITILDPQPPVDPLPGIVYIKDSIQNAATVLPQWGNYTHVIHLVSQSLPNVFTPIQDVQNDLLHTLAFLEALPTYSALQHFVFLSSGGAVYGVGAAQAVAETQLLMPRSSYGIIKGAMEHYINLYATIKGFTATFLRPGNIYGPGIRGPRNQNAPYVFLQAMKQNLPVKIWGDGSAGKDYIYLSDVAAAVEASLLRKPVGVFNLGTGKATSVLELIDLLEKVSGLKADRHFLPALNTDVTFLALNSKKAEAMLDWQPITTLEAGLSRLWEDLNSTMP